MNNSIPNRRRVSHSGLLDVAIRQVAALAYDKNLATRAVASEVLATLLKLRREMPCRRASDGPPARRQGHD